VQPSFDDLLLVSAIAFAAPFVLGLFENARLPSPVLEIVAGIVIGPSVLGWADVDDTVTVMATLGLAFLLFLAGLEIEFSKLRGRVLRLTAIGFALSFVLALAVGLGLKAAGVVQTPVLVAIILSATSLGVIIPVLKDAGEISSTFGQLVVAAGSIADFGAIILLSAFFSGEGGTGSTLLLIGSLFGIAAAVYVFIRGTERSSAVMRDLMRLQDTTAQIRVRGAVVLLIGFAALAEQFGLEAILGAFAAGAVLTLVDQDREMTHPLFRTKLESIGFGFFVPVFFVATGLRFDLNALLDHPSNLVKVPLFLAALLVVRGLPALAYRGVLERDRIAIAGVLQATSLPFIVAASAIGVEMGLMGSAESSALIAAGLLSVLVFPLTGLTLLRRASLPLAPRPPARSDDLPDPAVEVHVVALDLPRPLVRVVVERPARVGHLAPAVAALDGAEQGRLHALRGARLALRVDGRPEPGALAVAVRPALAIGAEHVDGLALGVEQHRAEPGLADRDRRRGRAAHGLAASAGDEE
jgi:Kef-type K+ transport system membrane component KefB